MVHDETVDIAIVGAGITGLTLATDLVEKDPTTSIKVFEKSKGCGGRMATRRIDDCKFDHGIPFVKKSLESERWIKLWRKRGVIQKFPGAKGETYCGLSGITQLAKTLAQQLSVTYECAVVSLTYSAPAWTINTLSGDKINAQKVILTSPLPQSLMILRDSNIQFDAGLKEINYSKALVILLTTKQNFTPGLEFEEYSGDGLLSNCSQHAKGYSPSPTWTLTMSPQWSQIHFDMPENQIIKNAMALIGERWPHLQLQTAFLKKWKYCEPMQTWSKLFECPAPNLFLAGDAFGGPNIIGALRSSRALFEHIHGAH